MRGWTWECIPSCSVVAGPAVPHPAFNRHPVPFICWSTRDAISWPHVTNAETTSHGHPRRVKCRGGDVNRRLQNEPSFGVNHRKVNRIRFRRRSCRPEGVSHVLLPLSAYNVRQKMVLTSTVCLATVASSRFLLLLLLLLLLPPTPRTFSTPPPLPPQPDPNRRPITKAQPRPSAAKPHV